jgi:hypothetical protein
MCDKHYQRQITSRPLLDWRERFILANPPRDGVGLVPLSHGRHAVVDAEDYERVMQHTWWLYEFGKDGNRLHYALTSIEGRTIRLDRFVLEAEGEALVRIMDGDGLNCRRSNLRRADQSRVQAGRRAMRGKVGSPYKGVTRNARTGRYYARVTKGRRVWSLGHFDDDRDAAAAYDEKARELFGPFARLNFPDDIDSVLP